ncbi:MAG: pantoate--beta-alanine ligase [Balneolaceae bacterium]
MKQIQSIEKVRDEVQQLRARGKTIAFVPTMGAFHEGHLSLIRLAKKHADEVVVSIYVNPAQFGPNEDFNNYPRQVEKDVEACEKEGVAIVFTPDNEIMYGSEEKTFTIKIEKLNVHMDGGSRPGFFEGIALVVNKLFNIIDPDVAVFGQKDIQQFLILSRMVKEFNHKVDLILAPIERANDGLALSSRNVYLNEEERKAAPGLYRSLQYVEKQVLNGVNEPALLLKHQQGELEAKGFKNDYFNVFSFDEIAPAEKLESGKKYILAGAVYLGKTRLIDNLILEL